MSKMHMGPIPEALNDGEVPTLTGNDGLPTHLGRFRLIEALRNKHGDNFKNVPRAAKALEHFDSEFEYARKMRKIHSGGK